MANKKYIVGLSQEEREKLTKITRERSSKSFKVKRSFILLAADEFGDKNWTDEQISQAYGVSVRSVERLRKCFVEIGLDTALNGKKQEVFREKIFDGRVESQLIALRCSEVPEGHSRWTLHLLADQMVELEYVEQISHESVRQILKKTKCVRGELKAG